MRVRVDYCADICNRGNDNKKGVEEKVEEEKGVASVRKY